FLCGQFFSFSHSGISAMASRFLIPCLSVLAINKKFCLVTIRRFERMPTFNFVMNAREILLPIYELRFTIDAWQGVKQRQEICATIAFYHGNRIKRKSGCRHRRVRRHWLGDRAAVCRGRREGGGALSAATRPGRSTEIAQGAIIARGRGPDERGSRPAIVRIRGETVWPRGHAHRQCRLVGDARCAVAR